MRRITLFATLVAVLLVLVGTTSYAASKYVITSSKQVKNGSLKAVDLSAGARAELAGATGPAGAQGPQGTPGATGAQGPVGPTGPSHAYSTSLDTEVALPASTSKTLMSVSVPAGDYVVAARIQGETGSEANPGNNYRFDCTLGGQGVVFDDPTYRVGYDPDVERYLTFQGAGTTTATGAITLVCFAGNGHDLSVISGQLQAIRVGDLN